MPEIAFDCCCLANFVLSDSLFILEKLIGRYAFITDFVSAEILRGIQQGHEGWEKIQEALSDGWLEETGLISPKEKSLYESLSVSLGLGEASSIAVAKSRRFIFACDDRAARREAGLLDIRLTGTIGLLKIGICRNIISLNQGNLILAEMMKRGSYSPVKSLKEV